MKFGDFSISIDSNKMGDFNTNHLHNTRTFMLAYFHKINGYLNALYCAS